MFSKLVYVLSLFITLSFSVHADEPPRLKIVGEKEPIDFFQPSKEQVESWGKGIIFRSELAEDDYYTKKRFIIVDDVPYYKYWQLDHDDAYSFHPSALGGYFWTLAKEKSNKLQEIFEGFSKLSVKLPNGGVTWYYPKVYPLNRMVGPKLQYSSFSQASLLGGAMAMAKLDPEKYTRFLHQVGKGMELDYHDGGVLWQGQIFLEFPLFYGPPEVILNGWIHSLLNYSDYVKFAPDKRNTTILKNNIAKLAEMLPDFDDKEHSLTLYSNATPLRVLIQKSSKTQKFRVKFRTRDTSFPSYEIDLAAIQPTVINGKKLRSPYDTQIFYDNGRTITALIACNQKYDTWIESDLPFSINFNTGTYVKTRATPAAGGKKVAIKAEQQERGVYAAHLDKNREKLFCGYPTNFGKNGKNLYHQYHIVSLLYLAKDIDVDVNIRKKIIQYAHLWMTYTEQHEKSGDLFVSYESVLSTLNSHKFNVSTSSWDELLQWSKEQ